MGEFGAIGDAITGAVLGRAVEPNAGEADGHSHEANCLNCGAPLIASYCNQCGQHSHVHRTLGAFFHDFAHGVLHFEGKIWRTLPLLAWKPGELTRRYIAGQRASFVSPIALFLFCVFLMFAVVGMTGSLGGPTSQKASRDISQELTADQQKLTGLQHQRDAAAKAHRPTEGFDDAISGLNAEVTALQIAKDRGFTKKSSAVNINEGTPHWLRRMIDRATANPELLFYKIKTDAYKFSWALIPISVPFVWLLFPFSRRFRLYDHTVFVTYSLCFMMLLLSAGTAVALASSSVASFAWFVPPVHMYRQLRGAYSLGRWGALWRAVLLTIFAFMAITLFAALLVALGGID
jgi:hypothetical protein